MTGLLEVTVLQVRDVAGAQEGGADRLFVLEGGSEDGLSPAPATVGAILREADVPVRVLLRLSGNRTTNGGEFTRLVGLAEEYVALGAEGVAFGFLDADLEVDVETCRALADALPGVPWTFTRAIDDTLEPRRSWRRVAALPGVDSVRSAGSPRGLGVGLRRPARAGRVRSGGRRPADARRRAQGGDGAVAHAGRRHPVPPR